MFGQTKFMLVGGCVGLLVVAYLAKQATGVVKELAPKLDPTNPDNIVNQAAESTYQSVTGSNGTIGGDFYDATHGGSLDATSDHNYAARAVNAIGGAISGDSNWDLGSKIYDWTH